MSDSESISDLDEIIAAPGLYQEVVQPPTHVNNKPALLNALSQISKGLPWIERLDVVTKPAPALKELDVPDDPQQINPDDDFKRENYFYRIAQAAVLAAIPQLHSLDVPTKRPTDFYAEMLKTDEQMGKIKQHLIEEQQRIALRERAKQIRERRKFGKQAQEAVLQARREEKRKLTEAIKASRKKSGKNQAEMLDHILNEYKNEYEPKDKHGTNKKSYHSAKDIANRRKINHQRDYKNKKYGHGGQKKRQKRNTSESLDGGLKREFNVLKHQATPKKAQKIRAMMRKTKLKQKRSSQKRRHK